MKHHISYLGTHKKQQLKTIKEPIPVTNFGKEPNKYAVQSLNLTVSPSIVIFFHQSTKLTLRRFQLDSQSSSILLDI